MRLAVVSLAIFLLVWTLPCASETGDASGKQLTPGTSPRQDLPRKGSVSVQTLKPAGMKGGCSQATAPTRFEGPASVQRVAIEALEEHKLGEEPGLEAFRQAIPGSPIFVEALDPDWADYYLVPLQVPQRVGVSAVAVVERRADFLSFGAISFFDEALSPYPYLASSFEDFEAKAYRPRWVFKLSQECMAPISPLIQYEKDGKTFFFTTRQESVTELTPLVKQEPSIP